MWKGKGNLFVTDISAICCYCLGKENTPFTFTLSFDGHREEIYFIVSHQQHVFGVPSDCYSK